MRDDPYYIMDDSIRKTQTPAVDVDSIPVIRLDDLPPIPKGPLNVHNICGLLI